MLSWFRTAAAAVILASPSVGYSAELYFKDEGLKTSTEAVATHLGEAPYLAPFDQQLKRLDAFDARENQSAAAYWTAARDQHFAIVSAADAARRTDIVREAARRRWKTLTGHADLANIDPDRLADLVGYDDTQRDLEYRRAVASANLTFARETFEAGREKEDLRSTECAKLSPAGSAPAYEAIRQFCQDIVDADTEMRRQLLELVKLAADQPVALNDAPLLKAYRESTQQLRRANGEDTAGALSDLAKEVSAAEKLAKSGASADAAQLRVKFRSLLDKADPVVRQLGWDKIGNEIDKLAASEICAQPADKVEKSARDAADCDAKTDTHSTGSKNVAVWTFVSAVAGLADGTSPTYRSAAWLTAAKAIVEAEKADAKLAAQAQKIKADAAGRQFTYMVREIAGLAATERAAGRNLPYLGCITPGFGCAFAAYLDSWNRGRIPSAVEAFQPVQTERRLAVQQARSVANRRADLIRSAVLQQKAYGSSGIDPKLVGGLAYDLAILFKVSEN